MFDTVGVGGRTRRPWTVAASFAGQTVFAGLAILLPLITTEALPRARLLTGLLPSPPVSAPHAAAQNPINRVKVIPFQASRGTFVAPSHIPPKVAMIEDPAPAALAGDAVGVPGGIPGAAESGNAVVDSLMRSTGAPLPTPPAARHAASPAKPQRIMVVSTLQTAKLIFGPRPEYPPLARQARISGAVHLQAVIARDGTILNLQVISGHPLLVPAALSAVKQWVFRPTYLNGEPVEVATDIVVNFALQQ